MSGMVNVAVSESLLEIWLVYPSKDVHAYVIGLPSGSKESSLTKSKDELHPLGIKKSSPASAVGHLFANKLTTTVSKSSQYSSESYARN